MIQFCKHSNHLTHTSIIHSLVQQVMANLFIVCEETIEQVSVVHSVDNSAGLSDRVHSQHSNSHVDGLDSSSWSQNWANCGSTRWIILYDKFLQGNVCLFGQTFDNRGRYQIRSVPLIVVDLQNNSFVHFDLMGDRVPICIVRVNAMSHVNW